MLRVSPVANPRLVLSATGKVFYIPSPDTLPDWYKPGGICPVGFHGPIGGPPSSPWSYTDQRATIDLIIYPPNPTPNKIVTTKRLQRKRINVPVPVYPTAVTGVALSFNRSRIVLVIELRALLEPDWFLERIAFRSACDVQRSCIAQQARSVGHLPHRYDVHCPPSINGRHSDVGAGVGRNAVFPESGGPSMGISSVTARSHHAWPY